MEALPAPAQTQVIDLHSMSLHLKQKSGYSLGPLCSYNVFSVRYWYS